MESTKPLSLFGEDEMEQLRPRPKRPSGGSANPIVFRDYESFIAKFTVNPKTTDECWTPQDVWEAVRQYVDEELMPLAGHDVLRPFYPGGNYEEAEYPEGGVVIDNPPFSLFASICKWYAARRIPFFIFGPGMTITSCCKYCTAVIVGKDIVFSNGANVGVNFATNLMGDTIIATAPRLCELLASCPSQDVKANLPVYDYPEELLSASDMQVAARGGISFSVRRDECRIVRNLDNYPKKTGLYGDHFLLSPQKAREKVEALAKAKQGKGNTIPIALSARERRIVEELSATN